MIRFYTETHISNAVVRELRRHGIDVQTSVEAGLRTAPDEEHLRHALSEERVLVTGDPDFLRLHRAGYEHAGIVFIRDTRNRGLIVEALRLVHGAASAKELRGRVEYQ